VEGPQSTNTKAIALSITLLCTFCLVWEAATLRSADSTPDNEYDALVAGENETARLPSPSEILALGAQMVADPCYDKGPNDKGIGRQLA
jgi:hypothetical protein